MTDEEEFSARSQLKWTRQGDAWILLYRRRRMGRVVPDKACTPDAMRLCSEFTSDVSQTTKCMMAKRGQLSAACRMAMNARLLPLIS